MPETNGRLQLRLSGAPGQKHLEIKDAVSGIVVAQVQLTDTHFTQLLSNQIAGSVEGCPAFIADHLERVGKHRGAVKIILATVDERADDLESWAGETVAAIGAATFIIQRHAGNRTSVVFRQWFDTPAAADLWAVAAAPMATAAALDAPGGAQ